MKQIVKILFSVLLVITLAACTTNTDNSVRVNNRTVTSSDPTRHSLYDSSRYIDMNYAEVETLFQQAGFENIRVVPVDDINSHSGVNDGSVISVVINGEDQFTADTDFVKEDEVVITYHNIRKIEAPISSDEAGTLHYMDVGKQYYDAGFLSVETDEVYDLAADAASQTQLLVNGQKVIEGTQLPFDSEISVIGHYPITKYQTIIKIDFEANWVFSKYDVEVALDKSQLGTLKHGEDAQYELDLAEGTYSLVFTNTKDSKVTGSAELFVNSQTEVTYHISCYSKEIDVERSAFSQTLKDNQIAMPFSSSHYLRKNYQHVANELASQGFVNVYVKPLSDYLWGSESVDSVVKIKIDGKSDFNHGDVFNRAAPVTVYYHASDFTFNESQVSVTEQESFELGYTLNSGEPLESINITIDHPELLRRNEGCSFTALGPGTVTITAYNGGNNYSECVVDIAEIVVPIEKLEFASDEIYVAAGSTFEMNYKIVPENANYKDMHIVLSNGLIETDDDITFYSADPGDTEVVFYQDDREIGTCTVHSELIDVDNVLFTGPEKEVIIGNSFEIPFTLSPENATNKGIHVTSSDSSIVEVSFDERNSQVINASAISAGEATITLSVPNGNTYTQNITVKEISPERITLNRRNASQKIEVGTSVKLSVSWKPVNTSDKGLSWSSSDSSVITVDGEGNLTTVGVGTAEITATHKSGVSGSISITVEPTPVTSIETSVTRSSSEKMYTGDSFQITASVLPQNATDQILKYSSSDESVAKVNENGVVTTVGVGTADIIISSSDGPKKTVPVVVSPAPQTFRITWSTYMVSNDHVGNNWTRSFTVDGQDFYSGSTITLDPDSSFIAAFYVTEHDTDPDVGSYRKTFEYSEDLCKNGYTESTDVRVSENRGRYSNHTAIWHFDMSIVPVH